MKKILLVLVVSMLTFVGNVFSYPSGENVIVVYIPADAVDEREDFCSDFYSLLKGQDEYSTSRNSNVNIANQCSLDDIFISLKDLPMGQRLVAVDISAQKRGNYLLLIIQANYAPREVIGNVITTESTVRGKRKGKHFENLEAVVQNIADDMWTNPRVETFNRSNIKIGTEIAATVTG